MKENCEIIYKNIDKNSDYEKIIQKVINKCFEEEALNNLNLYISITLTEPEEIKQINCEYRNINKETDVLSFPMFEKHELEEFKEKNKRIEQLEEAKDILGDIVISIPRVYEQAKEYGHSFERELAYMVVHGFYHLMGYDHMTEEDKKQMRPKEEIILNKLEIYRDNSNKSDSLNKEENKGYEIRNKNHIEAWKNAINGIIYTITTQKNMRIQLVIAVIAIIISLFFNLNAMEFLCFIFSIILVLFAEMVNTAIETVVDLYTDTYHPKAKIAKDVAAGGVVITAINAVVVGYVLFLSKLI